MLTAVPSQEVNHDLICLVLVCCVCVLCVCVVCVCVCVGVCVCLCVCVQSGLSHWNMCSGWKVIWTDVN